MLAGGKRGFNAIAFSTLQIFDSSPPSALLFNRIISLQGFNAFDNRKKNYISQLYCFLNKLSRYFTLQQPVIRFRWHSGISQTITG